jgi:hypothetical protein
MRAQARLLALPLTVVLMTACASQSGVQNAPLHAGDSRTFEANFDRVLGAAQDAVGDAGLKVESSSRVDDNTYMIMGKAGTSAFSWGEIVRVVVVKEAAANSTTVRVYTRRKSSVNIAAKGDYSNTIFSNIELRLRRSS